MFRGVHPPSAPKGNLSCFLSGVAKNVKNLGYLDRLPFSSFLFLFSSLFAFLRAKAAMLCLSVRPSVRLSHGWIRQKRSKLGSVSYTHLTLPTNREV